ncbi:YxiF family protein [Bacillus sp. D-CC]
MDDKKFKFGVVIERTEYHYKFMLWKVSSTWNSHRRNSSAYVTTMCK